MSAAYLLITNICGRAQKTISSVPPHLRQVVTGSIRKLAEHEPAGEQASQKHSSTSITSSVSYFPEGAPALTSLNDGPLSANVNQIDLSAPELSLVTMWG